MAVYVEAPAKRPRGQVSIGSQPNVSSDRLIIQELSEIKNEFLAHSAESFIIEDEATGSVRKNATQEFESSPAFQAAMTIAANRVDRFEGVDDFSRWFSGHLFSHFCFNEITNSLTDGSVLLNEQYSNIVCREVGGIKTIDDNKGIEMGDRSYLADGLQIGKDGRIDKVFEYTLSTDYYKFINQAKGFSYLKQALGKSSKSQLGVCFCGPCGKSGRS